VAAAEVVAAAVGVAAAAAEVAVAEEAGVAAAAGVAAVAVAEEAEATRAGAEVVPGRGLSSRSSSRPPSAGRGCRRRRP